MTDQESTAIIKADEAHKNYEQTVACRANLQANFLVLGRLLKENRDSSLYKFLGHDTFEEYLGAPELGFKRSTAYNLIKLIELYSVKLGVPDNRLVAVGTTKLGKIAGVVESDVDGWLDKAEHLSKSSLDDEIGRGPGSNSPHVSPGNLSSSPPVPALTSKQYLERVKGSPCCVCGREPATMAHFPRTRVRCGQPWHVIPLCGECHRLQEDGGMEWCWNNRQFWGEWYYKNIVG